MSQQKRQRAIRLFVVVLALTALANGLGNNILSNYFNEVFHIDSVQRGFIEIPRESPGILCMVLVAALGLLGDLWMSVAAQALVLAGFIVMGWMSPGYGTMLAFMFIHSLGMHLFMPLNDAVSMDLAEAFAQAVKEDISPRDSWRAAKDFRLHIAVESARRAFIESVKLAGGDL